MEPCEDFEQAFFRPETVETPPMLRYRSLGMYHQLLGAYLESFPRKQIQVIRLEDLQRSPQSVLRCIQDFLGVAPTELVLPTSNGASVPAGVFASTYFRQLMEVCRPTISHLTKHKSLRRIARTVQKTAFNRPAPLPPKLSRTLSAAFAEDQEALREFFDQSNLGLESSAQAFADRSKGNA